jgi:sortase (surface protein transpeptidase)
MRGLFCGEFGTSVTTDSFFARLCSFLRYYKFQKLTNFLPRTYFYKLFLTKFFGFILNFSIIFALGFVTVYYYPVIEYRVLSLIDSKKNTVIDQAFEEKQVKMVAQKAYEPSVDRSLPEGQWVAIPKIGVNSNLQRIKNSDQALKKGVWMAPDYGEVGDLEMPVILAAHRFGFKWWWKDNYYKKNSFYYLPDLAEGDKVELIKNQKKWIYEIYQRGEGEKIEDYNADLILYTCKFLNSPIRYFLYARLIEV